MRINQYVAFVSGLSRRAADQAIAKGQVLINNKPARAGDKVEPTDEVKLEGNVLSRVISTTTIILNKPGGYVCSRNGQGNPTIYELLPKELQVLKAVGRLDKDSSGLLLLTNDGKLAHKLSHPSFNKEKVYEVQLDKPLTPKDKSKIEKGVMLEDGISRLQVTPNWLGRRITTTNLQSVTYRVIMHEGRNRQIRRSFKAIGYIVTKLHRSHFDKYNLGPIKSGQYLII